MDGAGGEAGEQSDMLENQAKRESEDCPQLGNVTPGETKVFEAMDQ